MSAQDDKARREAIEWQGLPLGQWVHHEAPIPKAPGD